MNGEQDPCMCPINAKICRMMNHCPWLYDPKHPNYGKKLIIDESWKKIAEECNESVESCKERWGNIRAAILSGQLKIKKITCGPNRAKPYHRDNDRPFVIKPRRDYRPGFPEDINYNWDCTAPMSPILPFIGVMDGGLYAQGPNIQLSPGMMPDMEEELSEMTEADTEELRSSGLDSMMSSNTSHQPATSTADSTRVASYSSELTSSGDNHFSVTGHDLFGRSNEADAKFLEALLPDMRAMNTRQKIVFKRKIYQSLEEVFESNANFPTVSNSAPNIASAAPAAPAAVARGDANRIDPKQPIRVKTERVDDGGE